MNHTACLSRSLVAGALFAWAAVTTTQASPVFDYSFPASWDGTASVVTDLSGAGNHGVTNVGAALSDIIPVGATAGTKSLLVNTGDTTATRGGIGTSQMSLLNNAAIAAVGGFQYNVTFMWDGGINTSWAGVQKVMDYAGTESLQLDGVDGTAGTANLHFVFTADDPVGPDILTGPSIQIMANTWYQAIGLFETGGNPVAGDGGLSGLATLSVAPYGSSAITASVPVTKTTYGDSLNRGISVGAWAGNSDSVYMHGLVHEASVSLVPEPSTAAFLGLIGLAALLRRQKTQAGS